MSMSQSPRVEPAHSNVAATTISRVLLATLVVGIVLLLGPVRADASTLIEPTDGKHFDYLELAPMLTFDPATGESPKWILLASDAEMEKTVRYCRQFQWAIAAGGYHWGCNRWAVGVDAYGNDKLLALESGKTYYWQVVSSKTENDKVVEVKSAVRAFAIDAEVEDPDPGEIGQQVHDEWVGDGSYLNLGPASYVKSKVKVKKVVSQRLAIHAFRFNTNFVGPVNLARSYVKVTSRAGTRYLPVKTHQGKTIRAVWKLNATERRLRTKRFTYQVFLRSTVNGAMVRSAPRVLVIRSNGTYAVTTTVRPTLPPIS